MSQQLMLSPVMLWIMVAGLAGLAGLALISIFKITRLVIAGSIFLFLVVAQSAVYLDILLPFSFETVTAIAAEYQYLFGLQTILTAAVAFFAARQAIASPFVVGLPLALLCLAVAVAVALVEKQQELIDVFRPVASWSTVEPADAAGSPPMTLRPYSGVDGNSDYRVWTSVLLPHSAKPLVFGDWVHGLPHQAMAVRVDAGEASEGLRISGISISENTLIVNACIESGQGAEDAYVVVLDHLVDSVKRIRLNASASLGPCSHADPSPGPVLG